MSVSPRSNDSIQLTSTPAATYTYDNNGNTTSKTDGSGITDYTWDFQNQLTQIDLPSLEVVQFTYDPMGRRIRKVSASATVIYVYDGQNLIEELDAAGTPQVRYTQGPGIDQPLVMYVGTTPYYYHADGLTSLI